MAEEATSIVADSAEAKENAAVVAAFFREALSGGSPAAALKFLAADFRDNDPASAGASGPESVAAKLGALWQAFPDGRFALLDIVAAGDRVAARSRLVGTQTGPFGPLPPTGHRVDVAFFDLYRLEGGKLAEHWHVFDDAGLMRTLTGS